MARGDERPLQRPLLVATRSHPRPRRGAAAPASQGLGRGAGGPHRPGLGAFPPGRLLPPPPRQNQPWAEVAPSPSPPSRASGSFLERRRQVSLAGEPGGSALHGKRRQWPPSRAGGMSTPLAVAFLTPAWRWPLGMASEYCTGDEVSTLMGTRSFVPSFILSFVLRETREKLPPGVFHTFFKGPTANRAGECLLSRSLAVLELQLCPRGGLTDESRTGPWPLDESRTGPWPRAGGCALLCLPGVLRDTETIRGGGGGSWLVS